MLYIRRPCQNPQKYRSIERFVDLARDPFFNVAAQIQSIKFIFLGHFVFLVQRSCTNTKTHTAVPTGKDFIKVFVHKAARKRRIWRGSLVLRAGGLLALCASNLLVARPKGAKQGRSQWNSADLLCGEELDEGKLSRPVLN